MSVHHGVVKQGGVVENAIEARFTDFGNEEPASLANAGISIDTTLVSGAASNER